MRRSFSFLMLFSLVSTLAGCAGFSEYRKQKRQLRREQTQTNPMDQNWKQGYGFNNPNTERIKQGQEPVNFDGKTDSERESKNDFVGELLGDMIGYGLKSAFTGVVNAVKR